MWRLLAILCLAAVNMLAAATAIRDTVYTGFSGVLFAGRMTITAPALTTAGGRTVNRWQVTYTITAGVISVDLEPNITATPVGTSYYVIYRPTSGLAWSERWVVTVSETPLKVNQVRVVTAPVPTLMIQPSQIGQNGATDGQGLKWSSASSRWVPGSVASSWGSIAGTLTNQSDLNSALGGKAASSHGHIIGDSTGLQAALDGKANQSNRMMAEDYCTTPGVYNQTCIINAVAAVPSGGGAIHLGDRIYTIGATVAVTSKTNIIISGMGPQTLQLVAANSLNAAMMNFTDCIRCTLKDVGFDGNRANQTSGSVIEFHVTDYVGYSLAISNVRIVNAKDYSVQADAPYTVYGAVQIFDSEFANSGNSLIYADTVTLMLSGNRLRTTEPPDGTVFAPYYQVLLKNAEASVVADYFEAVASSNKMAVTPVAVDTGGSVVWLGTTYGGDGTCNGGILPINGATTASVRQLITGSTPMGKYLDAGSCYGTTPSLLASWATAGSLVCLGDNRAAVAMPHGADTSALFTFDISGIDLISWGYMTIAPIGVLPSGTGHPKFKVEWACVGTLLLGDASVPYSAWTVHNVTSWNGGNETQVRGFTQLTLYHSGLPSPCNFLQVKLTRTGTDSGDTKAATLSLVGLRIQYSVKTN